MLYKDITSKNEKGFTLIEIAIVLIIIGLILGMVFKGRQLIDNAKVKSLEANYNKIITAVNIFYDRYGFYPGDGCNSTPAPTKPSDCNYGKDGLLTVTNEYKAFWKLVIDVTNLLTPAERKTVSGTTWDIANATKGNRSGDWIYATLDKRYVCDLDRRIDDGDSENGIIYTGGNLYDSTTDCWSLNGTVRTFFYLFP